MIFENDNQNKQSSERRSRYANPTPTSGLGKLPPQAIDLEEAVLGALMLEKDALSSVIDILKPDVFYVDKHQKIFHAIHQLFEKSSPVDILTVTAQLRQLGELEMIGGAYYITELTNRVASAANIEFHSRIIIQKFIQRELIRISTEVIQSAYEDTTDVLDLLDRAEKNLFEIAQNNLRRDSRKMDDLLHETLKEIEALKDKKDGLTGVASGFTDLDRMTSGWQKSDLVIIAARPAMGKCLGKGTKVLMFDGTLKNVEDVNIGEYLMGDDSTPRKILSIARGREKMYWVRQNKGIDYRVNESHILSLKRSRNEGSHKKGDILNITVKDYLEKSDKFKSNYKGYKVAVEFEEKDLAVEPYFIGLWLGDGHAYSSRITNIDTEVIGYLEDYSQKLNLTLVEYRQLNRTPNYAITSGQRGVQTEYCIQKELNNLNLIRNKHIPKEYLINSTESRLELLAGLIDSDGHYSSEFNCYEIIQKNEALSRQIKFLCDSLGFKTSIKSKTAKLKSLNFESTVWRVRFFGDLSKVPVRVKRKKARLLKASADWRVTGLKVDYDKIDDYYGFEIDGNKLFLLEDMTVTHNTAFVLSCARNAAVDFSKPVVVFSLEMSSVQLVNRLISGETEIEQEKIRKGTLEEWEWAQIHSKIGRLEQAPLIIDDTPALNIFEFRAKCRRLKSQHDIQLIIIDYLQLMQGKADGKGGGNREQEIGSISRALKSVAKELNVPVIALSQLSRAVENRPGGSKRPMLSDLRESGSIEQDADMVLFLYRPEYYGLTEDEEGQPTQGVGEIIIAKHRNGETGRVRLKFVGKYVKFTDLDQGMDGFPPVASPFAGLNPSQTFDKPSNFIIRPSSMNDMEDEQPF